MPICITLAGESGRCAMRRANAAGLPVELWARLAIEGDRQLARAVALTGLDRETLRAQLDELADRDKRPAIGLVTRSLDGYSRLLRAAEPSDSGRARPSRLTVLIPDTLALAWTRAANANGGGESLSAWASDRVLSAPAGVVGWEAAAAAAGDSLGEWILAAAVLAARV